MQTIDRQPINETTAAVVLTDGTSVAFGVETNGETTIRGYIGVGFGSLDSAIDMAKGEARRIASAIRFDSSF